MGTNSVDIQSARITLDEVSLVLKSLKEQREAIRSVYKNKIAGVLDSSAGCFSVAGLDHAQISEAFNKKFAELDKKYYALIDVLENNVIKEYSEIIAALREMFNDKFASQMQDLLGLRKLVNDAPIQ